MTSASGLSRRSCLAAGIAALAAPAFAQTPRLIPQRPSTRVIIDNDFWGDPDGVLALAHQLLAPKTRVTLITSSALSAEHSREPIGRTAAAGRDLAAETVLRLGLATPEIVAGAETFGDGPEQISPAAHAIVREALRDDPLPLFVTCGGPLTNVAAALRLNPSIAERITLIWIGGGSYPEGGWEYNLSTDAAAARQVIERTSTPLWQIPQDVYRQVQFSNAEMTARVRPISPFSLWLYERFTSPPDFVDLGGAWPMGDSPPVLLTAVTQETSVYREQAARRITHDYEYGAAIRSRTIRVYETIDARTTLEDFLARLQLHAQPPH